MNTRNIIAGILWCTMVVMIAALLAGSTTNVLAQRDRGRNQPGAGSVGNPGRDAGRNQPGAVGNPGGAGRDPGRNQPGAVGNGAVGGSARQTRVGDPGFNQRGAAGNRR